ncbi:MAG: hypothetical protein LKI18_05810 [Prevotella sp.]|jgi:hypothetical protein|nr:hypothetical protein [Prevotella sp.]
MKKLILRLATVMTLIMIMSSCSKDSEFTPETENSVSSSNIKEISLNLNAGIEVSEENNTFSNNSETKASTRAAVSTPANFRAELPSQFTAYFVAAEATNEYAKGAIVRKVTVSNGNNNISVPAIKYHIYVTNYDPATAPNADNHSNQESAIEAIETSLPQNSTTLYLYGKNDADFSSTTSTANATVTLTNHYAAVCVANSHVESVKHKADQNTTISQDTDYKLNKEGTWYYMYIKAPSSGTVLTNLDIMVKGFSDITDGKEYIFSENITADNIYQYTVNEKGGLIISVDAFNGVKPTTTHYHVDWQGHLVKDN